MNNHIKNNLEKVNSNIKKYAEKAGRSAKDISLLAVSKTYSSEIILDAYKCGQRKFGENKIQELESKVPVLPDDIEWHLIGHLQSNKVAKAVELAEYIHSVDSVKLVNRINRIAGEKGKNPKILIEINVSGEENKFGASEDETDKILEASLKCENIKVVGLMTMAPFNIDENIKKLVFSSLRKLRDSLEKKYNVKLHELSMGMTSDYEAAVQEGSTIVRIGTAIFGKRSYD
ncbi:MAG: YggS family pyridoxal phosphate-dependent enzyme [Victivallales bacterium]|nr:YggS family pyridoxal phosphate-dependent enzyme [Victivallales bacterium]MCF7888635.1 YggS family pyridoxal phosphate-dependent enzyme [Victivallales bacterium]